jgi:hypothetical protein
VNRRDFDGIAEEELEGDLHSRLGNKVLSGIYRRQKAHAHAVLSGVSLGALASSGIACSNGLKTDFCRGKFRDFILARGCPLEPSKFTAAMVAGFVAFWWEILALKLSEIFLWPISWASTGVVGSTGVRNGLDFALSTTGRPAVFKKSFFIHPQMAHGVLSEEGFCFASKVQVIAMKVALGEVRVRRRALVRNFFAIDFPSNSKGAIGARKTRILTQGNLGIRVSSEIGAFFKMQEIKSVAEFWIALEHWGKAWS